MYLYVLLCMQVPMDVPIFIKEDEIKKRNLLMTHMTTNNTDKDKDL